MSITSDRIREQGFFHTLAEDAADEIEALEAENERLKALNVELTAKCNWYNSDGARLERERDELKRQLAAQAAQIEVLHGALIEASGDPYFYELCAESQYAIEQALSTTPSQALADFAAKMREQCAVEADRCSGAMVHVGEAIRNLKELS